jgi:aminoglycoside phosphotransferase (APT) family kinase protein
MPIVLESDPRWLGAPFLLMEWVAGRALGEVPALDPILQAGSPEQRRHLHEQFVDALSAVHRIDDGSLLPRLRRGLADELAYWTSYLDWASSGSPPKRLADALAWCRDSMPAATTNVLLWGDPRLGNAMYDGDTLIALLDWELASFGPPEMDLAWYLALGELTAAFMGANPTGMLTDNEFVRRYEDAGGSKPEHLAWHEIFALVRSTAVNDCMARLAQARGLAYPGVPGDDNPLLHVIWARIASVNS